MSSSRINKNFMEMLNLKQWYPTRIAPVLVFISILLWHERKTQAPYRGLVQTGGWASHRLRKRMNCEMGRWWGMGMLGCGARCARVLPQPTPELGLSISLGIRPLVRV